MPANEAPEPGANAARPAADRHRLALEPGNAAAGAARPTCGPGAPDLREAYPCAGPCLQAPGTPPRMNCIPSQRTCYRTRPAPPCK